MNQHMWASSLMESRGNLRINLSLSDPAPYIKKKLKTKRTTVITDGRSSSSRRAALRHGQHGQVKLVQAALQQSI